MTTNDRRKTFNTPLEFWQWAIQAPGKRKARTPHNHRVLWVSIDCAGDVRVADTNGGLLGVKNVGFPLTAVEDEHGVIPEEEKDEPAKAEAFMRHYAGKDYTRNLVALIDERIAAATVEAPTRVRAKVLGGWEDGWMPSGYRLKPKGDA